MAGRDSAIQKLLKYHVISLDGRIKCGHDIQ
jgi:hypothetical protein